MQPTLRVLSIIAGTSVDGPGLRTSIYFAGCTHHCPECHNQQSWNPDGGIEMTIAEILARIEEEDFPVTFSGGDPLMQIEALLPLAKAIKAEHRNLWCYTGYTIEQILSHSHLRPILDHIDVLVDGPFLKEQRDISLKFKGSANQRIIDVTESKFPALKIIG